MGTRIFQTTPVLQTRISQDRTGGVDSGEPPESDLGSERAAIPGRRAREEGVHRDDRGTQCTRVGLLSQVAASNELNFVSYRFPLPNTASYTLWDLYGPAFSCPFPVYRVGTMGDGGKWVCGLERATHHRNCVIYSMGVERQSSFEQEVLRQSPDCQVYGFDYSVSQWGPELLADTEVNGRAHFFPYKIGAVDNHDVTPKEYSLQGIMKELGHDFIDIWKIDIEGSEFSALAAVIESFKGQPLPFGQMQIEIHLDIEQVGPFDKWWTMLEDGGLRPFWTELNLLDVNSVRRGPFVGEVGTGFFI
ncbi:methyltransferase domain-containing protein [Mycena leptocephala]|nr:methyltransferase domain-containing protein [Mycena leptocephala]